jgi:hypothetical protein
VSVTENSEEILWILMSNILRKLLCIPAVLTESMLQFVAKYSRWTQRQDTPFCKGKWKFRKIRIWRNHSHMYSALQLYRYPKLYKTAITYQGSHISDQNCDSYARSFPEPSHLHAKLRLNQISFSRILIDRIFWAGWDTNSLSLRCP